MNTKPMDEKRFKRWAKTRNLGMLKFVLLRIIQFMLICTVIGMAIDTYNKLNIFDLSRLLSRNLIFIAFGLSSGVTEWKGQERMFKEYIEKENDLSKDKYRFNN